MAGISFGFGTGRHRIRPRAPIGSYQLIRPSSSWTGTAGSGYDAEPVDPVRITAKPAMRLLMPPNQYYSADLWVGVMAGANNGGSLLDNLGLEKVIVHFEGNTTEIAAPSLRTFDDANGNPVTYLGWWTALRHDGRNGHGRLYFEAVPQDPSMQHRIIGPFQFSPRQKVHDKSLTIEPSQVEIAGSRYQSFTQALEYLRSVGANNPLVTAKEPGTYDIGPIAAPYQGQGYCTIRADVPITFAKSNFTTIANAALRPAYDGLHFIGSNITFDRKFLSTIYSEDLGRHHWLDGVTVLNSLGRDSYWAKGTNPDNFIRLGGWLTECSLSDGANICTSSRLVRGCTAEHLYGDAVSGSDCVVGSIFSDIDSGFFRRDVDCLTLTYSGSEASATLELSGENDGARVFTARWGTNSSTLNVAGQVDDPLDASDFKAWIEGLGAGFSCTVLDNSRRISACGLPDGLGAAFGPQNVKNTTLALVTTFDVSADWYRQLNNAENVIMAGNRIISTHTQDMFLAGTDLRDFLSVNNSFFNSKYNVQYYDYNILSSQLDNSQSHVVIAHNSFATQAMILRSDMTYDPDQYCLIANNVFTGLSWSGSPDGDLTIASNHLNAGATAPANATGTSIGGTDLTLFADAANGDFAARGALRSNPKLPSVRHDSQGRQRSDEDAAGSELIGELEIVAPSAPAYGSAQFPNFNRRYAGLAGHIAYPVTNLVTTPLLKYNVPSAFFIMLQIPRERTGLGRRTEVFGNSGSSYTNGRTFGLTHYGDDYFSGALHDRFHWHSKAGGISPDYLDLKIDVQTRFDLWQLITVTCDGAGNYAITSFSPGLTKLVGNTQNKPIHTIDNMTGSTHVLVGDSGNSAGILSALAAPNSAFGGAIAFHGFVNGTAGNDAQWQAICEGADIEATLTGASGFRLLRDYRGADNLGDALAAMATGDNTSGGTIYGTVKPGGTQWQSPAKYLHFDRLPDGYVICPPDGATKGAVMLTGKSAGLTGKLYGRVMSQAGATLAPPFEIGTVAGTMSVTASIPPFAGWGFLEAWAESDPDTVYRMNARIGCGHKLAAIGQSQVDRALYGSGLSLTPSGFVSVCYYTGLNSDPGDTTSNPVPRLSTASRPQLFVIEPEIVNTFNGVTAMAERIAEHTSGEAICVIDAAIPGTSALAWIDDNSTTREWALDVEVAALAGTDRVPVWQWHTSDPGGYPEVLDGVVHGTGIYAGDHTLFDGSINDPGYKLGICLPSRATSTTAGPLDFDDAGNNLVLAQAGQIAWALANPSLGVLGPAVTDMAIDNNPAGTLSGPHVDLGGPHQSNTLPEGNYRLGYRMGETYLRARGLSPSCGNPYIDAAQITINGGRNVITVKAVLPNGGALKTQTGAVKGFELSTDGGVTWTRSGFAAAIADATTVTLTKTSGTWAANTRLTYLRGGPFSYGTAEELNAHYKGSLYDGCEAESGLGLPLLGISTADAVVV